MSDKEAGWYPDPDGKNRQRYWDGDSWTEYYTPLAPEHEDVHGSATAVADYPYLAATRGRGGDVMLAPSTSSGGGWPGVSAPRTQEGETLEFSGGGRRSSASRWAMVAATALVVLLVVGVGWWAFGGGGGPLDPTADPSSSTPAPSDGPTVTGDVSVGTTSDVVPGGGLWVGTLTVDTETTFVLDLRSQGGGGDLRVEVRPEGGGDPVGGNDDRGNYLLGVGGNSLDPFTAVTLPAGTYEVAIDDRDGAETAFDLDLTAVTETFDVGASASGTIPDSGAWITGLVVPSDGDYVVDVDTSTSGADPVLVAIGPDGRVLVSDDESRDDVTPLLEQQLTQGVWLMVLMEYYHDQADVTISAQAA